MRVEQGGMSLTDYALPEVVGLPLSRLSTLYYQVSIAFAQVHQAMKRTGNSQSISSLTLDMVMKVVTTSAHLSVLTSSQALVMES